MTDPFELLRDERILDARPAIYSYNWILAAEGTLYLTSKRLVFAPTGKLDRSIGMHDVSIHLRNVLDLGCEGTREVKLVVKTEDRKHSFRVDDICKVFLDAAQVAMEELRRKREPLGSTIPAALPPTAARPAAAATPATGPLTAELNPPTHGRAVLILGNTDFYGVMLSDLVSELKAPVIEVSSADEAFNRLVNERAEQSLVIVNLLDPRIGGAELLEKISDPSVFVGAPVWVIEPLFEKREEAELRSLGVSGFLDKSVTPAEFADLVNRLLRGHDSGLHRRHARVAVHFPVEYRVEDRVLTGYARTIGLGGCFLETVQPSPLGTELKLRFQLPALDVMLELEARVVYMRPKRDEGGSSRGPGMGLKFLDVPTIARDTLHAYIEEHLKYKVNEATVTFGL